jgi:hypothetical protein
MKIPVEVRHRDTRATRTTAIVDWEVVCAGSTNGSSIEPPCEPGEETRITDPAVV